MNLDLRFRPGLGGHQVPKTACNTVCCGINLDFMFRLILNQCLEGIRLPNSLQDLLLRVLSMDLLKLSLALPALAVIATQSRGR